MFEVKKIFKFEACHWLEHHDGHCSRPHGHSYVLTVHVRGEMLNVSGPKTNMLIDFGDISAIVKPMIDEYCDHRTLNDTLNSNSTTAEFIAKWIYDYLKPKIPGLYAITINETTTSQVTYTGST